MKQDCSAHFAQIENFDFLLFAGVMNLEQQCAQLLLLERKPAALFSPPKKLPAPCSMQTRPVDEVLSAVKEACVQGNRRAVSILVSVNNSHAVVARGHDAQTDLTSDTLAHTMNRLLPALGAVFGSSAQAATVMARTNVGSHAGKGQRRKIRRQARSEAMRKLSEHISFALILDWAATLKPLACLDKLRKELTHSVTVTRTGIEFEHERVVVGADSVHGPKPPTRHMVTQFVDSLQLELGQRVERLPIGERSELSEGVGLVRNLRRVVAERLNFLFEAGAVLDTAARNFTIFFRLGGDFGHCARFTVNNVPYLLDTVGFVPDPAVFEPDCATAVSDLLIFVLARERDQLDGVQFYAQLRADSLMTLSEPLQVYNEAGDVEHSVTFQVLNRLSCAFSNERSCSRC